MPAAATELRDAAVPARRDEAGPAWQPDRAAVEPRGARSAVQPMGETADALREPRAPTPGWLTDLRWDCPRWAAGRPAALPTAGAASPFRDAAIRADAPPALLQPGTANAVPRVPVRVAEPRAGDAAAGVPDATAPALPECSAHRRVAGRAAARDCPLGVDAGAHRVQPGARRALLQLPRERASPREFLALLPPARAEPSLPLGWALPRARPAREARRPREYFRFQPALPIRLQRRGAASRQRLHRRNSSGSSFPSRPAPAACRSAPAL